MSGGEGWRMPVSNACAAHVPRDDSVRNRRVVKYSEMRHAEVMRAGASAV